MRRRKGKFSREKPVESADKCTTSEEAPAPEEPEDPEVLAAPPVAPPVAAPMDMLGFPRREETQYIVIHCSATKASLDIGFKEIDEWHRGRGWGNENMGCGYHGIIRRDGTRESGRPLDAVGAHAYGYNYVSVGICLVGGVNDDGHPCGNFTTPQYDAFLDCVLELKKQYPKAKVVGHRDLSPDINGDGVIEEWEWLKHCPCMDVTFMLKRLSQRRALA